MTAARVNAAIAWLRRRDQVATTAAIAERLGTEDVAAVEAALAALVAAGKIREMT